MASTQPGEGVSAGADGRIRRRYGSIMSRRPLPVRFDHGDPPPSALRRIIHWWRYGSYHADEDLLGVIDAAIDSLTTQIKAAEGVLTGSRRDRLDALRTELNAELNDEVPELAVLLGIEAKIHALFPPAVQRRRAWMIEERFRRVAPGHAADYWTAVRGDTTLAEEHEDRVRRADEAVASATAAQTRATEALASADEALAKAKADHGDASAEAGAAQTARDGAADENGVAERMLAGALLERDLVNARCELERIQARLRGAERAGRERPGDAATAAGLIETLRQEATEAQSRVDAAAAAVQVHAAAGEGESEAGSPPADGSAETDAAAAGGAVIDAEAQALLGYIHNAYLMGIARERAVRDLMRWLMMRFWSANVVLLLVLAFAWILLEAFTEGQYAPLIIGLFAIAAIGRVGATMSVVQRLQRAIANNVLAHDPIQELTRLRTGKNGINVALFSGGVFALLTYAFFASGVPALLGLDDGAAPAIGTIQDDAQAEAQQQVVSQNIARAARDLDDQEQRVRQLEAELREARGTTAGDTPDETGDTPGADQPPREDGAPAGADADRIAQIEAQLAEATAVLEQRRSSLAVAAAAAAPPASEPVANEPQEAAEDPVTGDSDPPADEAGENASTAEPAGNDSAASVTADNVAAGNATADNAQAAADASANVQADNVQADDDKPDGDPAAAPVAVEMSPDAGDQCNAKEACDPFVRLALALGLNEREDFFKLLIWAFIAGFAERLVPDALDAIANRSARRRRRQDGLDDETA